MQLTAIYITNNVLPCSRAHSLHKVELLLFVPDGNGMRYEKVVNGVKTYYYYDGTTLLMESKNGLRT